MTSETRNAIVIAIVFWLHIALAVIAYRVREVPKIPDFKIRIAPREWRLD